MASGPTFQLYLMIWKIIIWGTLHLRPDKDGPSTVSNMNQSELKIRLPNLQIHIKMYYQGNWYIINTWRKIYVCKNALPHLSVEPAGKHHRPQKLKIKESASHHLIYVKIVRILIPDGFRSYFSTLFDDLQNHHLGHPAAGDLNFS